MPGKRGGRRRARGGKRGVNPVDAILARNQRAGTNANLVTCSSDLTTRPVRMVLSQSPPKNIRSLVHWFEIAGANPIIGTGISNSVETYGGFAFALNQISGYASYLAVFDQYCLYSVNAFIKMNGITTNNSASTGQFCSAIDFDNNATPSSFASLANYGTSQIVSMTYGLTCQRFIKPCIAEALYSGSAFSDYGVGRAWIDSASADVQHYGLKLAWKNNATSSLTYDFWWTAVVGFRNNI
jgi:hypothetical protein